MCSESRHGPAVLHVPHPPDGGHPAQGLSLTARGCGHGFACLGVQHQLASQLSGLLVVASAVQVPCTG